MTKIAVDKALIEQALDSLEIGDNFRPGLARVALRAALAEPAVEPVHPRHPVVVKWRNDGIEACAGIADAYGNADAARDMRALITSPQPPAESVKPPGMAVQALAGEIVSALLADEKDGGCDLTAGMFGPAFSALVRRWAAAEWNSPPAEPAVEPRNGWLEAAVAWEVCASIHANFAKGKDPLYKTRHNDFVSHAERARKNATTSPPPPAEPARTSQDVCTVPLLSDEEILQLTPLWFKKYTDGVLLGHARAIEQLVRRKDEQK